MQLSRKWLFPLLLGWTGLAKAQSVGVFLPISYNPKELQTAMKSDPLFEKAEITIFQKLEDFLLVSESKKFQVALLPISYEKFYSDYAKKVQLVSASGEKSFKNLVVSFKKDAAKDLSVGVIDEVGRKNLKAWFKGVCSTCGKQKDVKKAKDLYNMLALGSVDAILVSPFNYETFKKENAAELVVLFSGGSENYPALFVPQGGTFKGLENIKPGTFAPLGLKVGGAE